MPTRSTILLLIPHLGGGGAERVMELLARHLSPEKYALHLGLVTQGDGGSFGLPACVCVHLLGAGRVRYGALRLLRLIWRLRPRLILSGMAHLNLLVLLLRPLMPRGMKILVRQNGTVATTLQKPAWTGAIHWLARLLYHSADRVICQSDTMAEEVGEFLKAGVEAIAVLPNPIDTDRVRLTLDRSSSVWDGPGPHLLAVGRLAKEKGFDLLLSAFAAVRQEFPSADLTILGEGPELVQLEHICGDSGFKQWIRFPGHVPDPSEYFRDASLLATASRHEGMPNAVLEAAAAGLPIVATPAAGGLVDLLQGQEGVWMAREISSGALAESLRSALRAIGPGERFIHQWLEGFQLERAIPAYERVIDTALGTAPP
jgi:glycosyltransferase involved in cell wall biosynthesis